jgi:uncharacterized membrane protein
MTAGVLASAACFTLAILLELVGGDTSGGRMTDPTALRDGLVAMAPWAWAGIGTYILIVTPAVALLVTVYERLRAGDRATAGFAVLVLLVLSLGCLVAVVR